MKTSAITTAAFTHYADTIGALHQSDRASEAYLRRQFVVTLAVLVALGGAVLGLG